MNPYASYSLNDFLTVIKESHFLENTNINDVCEMALKSIILEQEGVLFLRTLRKEKNYIQAEEYHKKLEIKYPNSVGLKSEVLWLRFSSKICDSHNKEYTTDANYILNNTSQTEPATKLIFEITTLFTISRLISDKNFSKAYTWTTKLNPMTLSDKGRKGSNGVLYSSNRQQFYNYKAKSLIGTGRVEIYINWIFQHLKFTEEKRKDFVDHVINSCTLISSYGNEYINDKILSNLLYKFDTDLISSTKYLSTTTTQPDAILLSELSQYLFCPVSFVINKNFNIPATKPMDSSSKWKGNKDGFYDRYIQYQKNKNIVNCFEYNSPEFKDGIESVKMGENDINIFEELFKGSIKVNNSLEKSPYTFSSDDNIFKGAPDYLLELTNGKRVLISEKFSTSNAAGATKIYNSDTINLEAYLTKFKNLKIDYAYFINWNWSIYITPKDIDVPQTNTMYVNKVHLQLMDLSIAREALVDSTSEKINLLKSGTPLKFNSIGFPGKCINCSVYNYCEHKSGVSNELRFPYNI